MGCNFSCKRSSSKSKNIIRIVHVNGYIEYIENPVTVAEVVDKHPKHFLFTHPQLMAGATTHLKPDHTRLEPGRAYFLLPYSLFGCNFSPVDLAPLSRQLAATAQNSRRAKPAAGKKPNILTSCAGGCPYNCRHFSDRRNGGKNDKGEDEESSSKSRSWKPLLATIRERSMNRRSESDLQENHVNIDKL